ncbi:hypothetical protein SRABI80_04739 [Peribacillus frigoritolerans]|nr:hypothetical protein SRABI80_04739 [Peribacillus frigoritolerans]
MSGGRLLKEALEVFQRHPEWEFHIGGFGPLEEYIKDIAGKSENIFYYGKIPYKTVIKIEKACDILFAVYNPSVPNHKYSSPNKLYEAMMLGKPIIVSKDTGIDKVVDSHNLGVVINYTEKDFERGINTLIKEQNSWQSIGENAKELYFKKYSWDIMEQRLIELYNKLL